MDFLALVILTMTSALLAGPGPGTPWPLVMPPSWTERGPGGGLAVLPAAVWWLLVLAWMHGVDWVFRDAIRNKLSSASWCIACGLPLFVVALLVWWLPLSLIALPLMFAAYAVPMISYAVFRNPKLPPSERILTTGHARRIAAGFLGRFGIEIDPGLEQGDLIPNVVLAAAGGKDATENQTRLEAAAKLPGFDELQRIMLGAVMARATTLIIDLEQQRTSIQHEVDGVLMPPRIWQTARGGKVKEAWVEAPSLSVDQGQAVKAALKALCGLTTDSRDTKNSPFVLQVDGKPRHCRLFIRRQPTAEQIIVRMEAPAAIFKKLEDLGMASPLAEQLLAIAQAESGLIVLSSPPDSGLTTTFDTLALCMDRLLRDFISIEDAATPARSLQNVRPVQYDARSGTTALQVLQDSLRSYPNVIFVRDVNDKKLVLELVKLAAEGKLVLMSVKAIDATDAIARIAACGAPPEQLAAGLKASLGQRLIRRLCPRCREEFPPPQALLTQLKLTLDQLPKLNKASSHGCRICGGTGYLGRTAIFELAGGASLRKAVQAAADPVTLRKAAVRDGMKPIREAGLALVVSGATSLDEVQRATAVKPQPTAKPSSSGPRP